MKKRIRKNRGFTLIELLVVIAIIGLLSSIVLAALANARVAAQTSARVSAIRQYVNAIELYYSQNGYYPNPATSPSTADFDCSSVTFDPLSVVQRTCLGTGYSGVCGTFGMASTPLNSYAVADANALSTALSPFIPGTPGVLPTVPVVDNGTTYYGAGYSCTKRKNGQCTGYVISYTLQGNNKSCIGGYRGASPFWGDSNATGCLAFGGDMSGIDINGADYSAGRPGGACSACM